MQKKIAQIETDIHSSKALDPANSNVQKRLQNFENLNVQEKLKMSKV